MNTPLTKNPMSILLLVLGIFLITAAGAFFVGKKMFPKNLSPAMQDFRSYLKTTEHLDIDGSLVRRDRTTAHFRAIFHIGERTENHFFFIEEFGDEKGATFRREELGANTMVTPARVTQHGVFVLYISNDWNPEDSLAKQLQQAFLRWGASPSGPTSY